MNPLYNKNLVTLDDMQFLHQIKDQERVIFSNASVRLFVRGILEELGYHNLQFTLRGKLLTRYVAVGATVMVQDSYRLPFMRGEVGTVIGINESFIDADGIDEYGYTIHRKKPSICVSVVFPSRPGQTWCFYNPEDLYGQFASMQLPGDENYNFFRLR